MSLTSEQKLVSKISCFLGGLQGIVWAGLSLTCIVIYYSEHKYNLEVSTFTKFLSSIIYALYLNKELSDENSKALNRTIRAEDFVIVMWFYFFLSVGILVTSIDLSFAIGFNRNRKSKLMILWGILTGCISLIDLVFTSLLLRDFTNCPNIDPRVINTSCQVVVGVVMTIAARGFTLLFVNGFLSFKMITTGIEVETLALIKNNPYDVNIPRVQVKPRRTIDQISTFGRSVSQQNEYNEPPSALDRRYVY